MDNLTPTRQNLLGFAAYLPENEVFLISFISSLSCWRNNPNGCILFPTKRSAKRFIKKHIADLEPTATYCSVYGNDKTLATVVGGTFND
jgi:hypothetical protein